MIGEIMAYLNNYFERCSIDGDFTVAADGSLSFKDQLDGFQFIAILGSTHSDGVHRVVDGCIENVTRMDDHFTGRVWLLSPPAGLVRLSEEIAAYAQKSAQSVGPFTSETFFGDYSYTKATGAHGVLTWQEQYASALMPYRRMFTEVCL